MDSTIGLEIHCQLKTRTKLFCGSLNDPNETRPNINVCPVCLAHPGTLPVLNKEAVRQVLRVGLALGGQLADFTEWDRKNYFYPDLPKGYQISQYEHPLVAGGELLGVAITRVHLEEDTGRLQHDEASLPGQTGGASLVDFNRAGVPLMELVTEPVITSATQAGDFARELQLLFRYLGASDADMEKGQMRVEANVSISQSSKGTRLPDGQEGQKLGVKTEIKNLNSFRSVERAIEYELARQQAVLAAGGQVVQETRGWDESRGVTYSQRQKESSHDYRYFPEPDLPKLFISQIPEFQNLAATIPELPAEKRKRLRDLGFLQEQDVEQLVSDAELAALFGEVEQILAQSKDELKIAVNLILNNVVGQKRKDPSWLPPAAALLAEIARGKQAGTLSAPQVNKAIVEKKIVAAISDDALVAIVEKVIAAHPTVVADYKAGKPAALQFLIGQAMQVSKGSANPQGLRELLLKKL